MALEVDLYVDIVNSELVLGLNNATQFQFGKIFQGSAISFRIFPVKPTNNQFAPYFTLVDISGLLARIGVGPRAGATALLASQDVWTPQFTDKDGTLTGAIPGTFGCFKAVLNLNTTELNAAIGSSDSYSTIFEIQLSEAAAWRPVAQRTISITPTVWDPSGAANLPSAAANYPTIEMMKALCVLVNGNPNGRGFTLQDSTGAVTRVCYIGTDGEFHAEAET
jgi:hypothetical protein